MEPTSERPTTTEWPEVTTTSPRTQGDKQDEKPMLPPLTFQNFWNLAPIVKAQLTP